MYNHLAETGADPLIPRDAFNRHPRTTTNFAQIPLRPASKNIFRLLFLSIIFFNQIKTKFIPTFCSRFCSFISNLPPPLHKHTGRRTLRTTIFVKWPKKKRYDSNSLYSIFSLQHFSYQRCPVKGHKKAKEPNFSSKRFHSSKT